MLSLSEEDIFELVDLGCVYSLALCISLRRCDGP